MDDLIGNCDYSFPLIKNFSIAFLSSANNFLNLFFSIDMEAGSIVYYRLRNGHESQKPVKCINQLQFLIKKDDKL